MIVHDRVVDRGQHPQVTATGHFDGSRRHIVIARWHTWSGRLPHRIGQCFQIVARRLQRIGIGSDTDNLPAHRGGQPGTVHIAQVVAVWFGIGRKWAEHRGGIPIDIGERRDGRLIARWLGAATTTHAGTLAAHRLQVSVTRRASHVSLPHWVAALDH